MPTASASALLEIRASTQGGQDPAVDVIELAGPNILRQPIAGADVLDDPSATA